jgi:ABC-type histidine transport system ATPase subunit
MADRHDRRQETEASASDRFSAIQAVELQVSTGRLIRPGMIRARDVAEKIVFMDRGGVVESGTPVEFLGAPKSERAREFLSSVA